MYSDDTRKRLEDIIAGKIIKGQKDCLTTTRNYLCASFGTNTTVKKDFDHQSAIKKEQGKSLKQFIGLNQLWLQNFPSENAYLTQGGEASIYLDNDKKSVIKLNDAVYYNTWLDFLNSVLIHNVFFEETSYELLGFREIEGVLLAILKQPFIILDAKTELTEIKTFLEYNGFANVRRNDYYNKELGLILEDMHDENVITSRGNLHFIDTVFYIHVTE